MRHFESWINRRNGNYKKTTPFTIDVDGTIYQHYDPKYYSDFLNCEQDKCNIPIILVIIGSGFERSSLVENSNSSQIPSLLISVVAKSIVVLSDNSLALSSFVSDVVKSESEMRLLLGRICASKTQVF